MCTLIVLHRCAEGAPLVIAANRDEYLDRPARGPQLRLGPGGMVVAPLDVRAGGTWLGLSRDGLFAGITNRPATRPDPARRSRGLLVLDALGAPSAREAAERLARLPEAAYNPFNLLVADARDAFVARYEEAVEVRLLAPGPHVVGNADVDDRRHPKVGALLERAAGVPRDSGEAALDALAAICREHAGHANPLQETCIHTERYGTRSSTLLATGSRPVLRYADGPPCRSAYEDFTPLLHELGLPDRVVTGERATRNVS